MKTSDEHVVHGRRHQRRARPHGKHRFANPFFPLDDDAYLRWRDWKLEHASNPAADPVVEIRHPAHLTASEHAELVRRLRSTNMAVYECRGAKVSKSALHRFASQLGLRRPDAHLCADSDYIASIRVRPTFRHGHYIPYTNHALSWHTDGYYNAPHARIRSFVLHCVQSATDGGDSMLLDPDIVYLLLRDQDPEHIRALCRNDVMSIPPNVVQGRELRPRRCGPVFSVDDTSGSLHMRYSARKRNIHWRRSAKVSAALAALEDILSSTSDRVVRHRLEPGQGILCNNVLHRRDAFRDGTGAAQQRLLYRARYYDRVDGTGWGTSERVGQPVESAFCDTAAGS